MIVCEHRAWDEPLIDELNSQPLTCKCAMSHDALDYGLDAWDITFTMVP